MGYSTDFDGEFEVAPALSTDHKLYLESFSDTRRMKRDSDITVKRPDLLRERVGLDVGIEGEHFVGAGGFAGQEDHGARGLIDYNLPPTTQPGLWCKWIPNEDGTAIEWSGAEKFSDYIEWIKYLIEHFLEPWDYVLNGEVRWQGEGMHDVGVITTKDNKVSTRKLS